MHSNPQLDNDSNEIGKLVEDLKGKPPKEVRPRRRFPWSKISLLFIIIGICLISLGRVNGARFHNQSLVWGGHGTGFTIVEHGMWVGSAENIAHTGFGSDYINIVSVNTLSTDIELIYSDTFSFEVRSHHNRNPVVDHFGDFLFVNTTPNGVERAERVRIYAPFISTIELNSVSGNIFIDGTAWEWVNAYTVSGDINIVGEPVGDRASSTNTATVSGNINLDIVGYYDHFSYEATSISGSVNIRDRTRSSADPRIGNHQITADTVSGNVRIDFIY